jgi:hypothetical protein
MSRTANCSTISLRPFCVMLQLLTVIIKLVPCSSPWQPLVSTDYTNDTRSCIVDALSTQVIDGTMVKIYAWYDNEAGYSKRMAELCNIAAAKNISGTEPAFVYE